MKRYSPKVEHLLYRLYCVRQSMSRLLRNKAPDFALVHGKNAMAGYASTLERLGLFGDELEQAITDRWLDFEADEMRFEKMDRCLVYLAQVQVRIKYGVPRDNPKAFACDLHSDCLECECFKEASEEQQSNFNNGCDIETGQPIPGFQIEEEGEQF